MVRFIVAVLTVAILFKVGWSLLKLTAGALGLVLSIMFLPVILVGLVVTGFLYLLVPIIVIGVVIAVMAGILRGPVL